MLKKKINELKNFYNKNTCIWIIVETISNVVFFCLVAVDMNNKNLRWNFISFRRLATIGVREMIEYFFYFFSRVYGLLLLFELHRSNTSFINK